MDTDYRETKKAGVDIGYFKISLGFMRSIVNV
jgi:hypothetical protein